MFRSRNRGIRLGIALGCLIALAGNAWGQTTDATLFRDLWQTVQARKAIQDDPQLASLNLGVKVSNGVAVLWGPVPSRALALRAEQHLRGMVELVEIRDQMAIESGDAAPLSAPQGPRYLPEPAPAAPANPGPPALEPRRTVILAGIITPEETLTARSSPAALADHSSAAAIPALHIPFLGSVSVPR